MSFLHAHIKVVTGTIELIENLKEFCKEDIKVEDYHNFFHIRVNTDFEHFGSYFCEKTYGDKDYGIRLFKRQKYNEELFIQLKYIDCIYSL